MILVKPRNYIERFDNALNYSMSMRNTTICTIKEVHRNGFGFFFDEWF